MFLSGLMSIASVAQDREKVDSLLNIVHNSEYDTAKVFALKWLSWEYYFASSDSTDFYLDQMIDLSDGINFKKGLMDAYNIRGIVYYTKATYDSAITTFTKAFSVDESAQYNQEKVYSLKYSGESFNKLARFQEADSCFRAIVEIAKKSNDSTSIAKGYKAIAQAHYDQSNYAEALKYHFKADSFMMNDISIDHAENFQNMAHVYHVLENQNAEMRSYEEALRIYEAMDDSYGVNAIYLSLGAMENDNQNYRAAKEHLLKAHGFFKDYNDPLMLAEVEYHIGKSAYHLGETDEALMHYKKAHSKVDEIQGSVLASNLYRDMGELYSSLQDYEQAIYFFKKALSSAQKVGNLQSTELALEALADLYFQSGQYKNAYTTMKEHRYFNDSINALHSDKVLHELEAKYQTEKKEKQIDLLTAQNQLAETERKVQLYVLLGIVLIIFILALLFYILYRNVQKMTSKLQELDSAKSNFFANISHEFRTPLTLIKGPIQNELSQQDLEDDRRENLQMINRNTDRLLSLVDQLLDLSRLESGSLQLKVAKGSLSSFSNVITAPFQYLAEQKRIGFTADISADSTGFYDKDVLEKIITNLLSNAIKYTPEDGKIHYDQVVRNGWAVIKVSNSGDGIPKDQQEKVFDRFYQMGDAREGVGIGLALVKELITLHKGSVRCIRDENEFTCFEVRFPIADTAYSSSEFDDDEIPVREHLELHTEEQDVDAVEEIGSSEKPIMLIVDDSADLRRLIKDLFSKSYSIVLAENGEEGINKAIEHVPDIIVSDVMMPVKDGVDLTRTLKADERTSHVPIILLTARAGEENELKGLETGADEYMVKPFNNEILKVRVEKLIELRAQLRARYSQEVVLRPKDIAITSVDEVFLDKVQLIVDTHITKPDFTAELFSKEIGMSRMQLHRKIKALLGLSTSEFIRSQRLKMAAKLLGNHDINISEVGYSVGFNDPSYFAKCFKEAYGCTPTQYMAEVQTDS